MPLPAERCPACEESIETRLEADVDRFPIPWLLWLGLTPPILAAGGGTLLTIATVIAGFEELMVGDPDLQLLLQLGLVALATVIVGTMGVAPALLARQLARAFDEPDPLSPRVRSLMMASAPLALCSMIPILGLVAVLLVGRLSRLAPRPASPRAAGEDPVPPCPRCGYGIEPMRGRGGARCSECGTDVRWTVRTPDRDRTTWLLAAATAICLSALGALHLMSAPIEEGASATVLAAAIGAAFLLAGGIIGARLREGWEQRSWHRPSSAWRALPLGLVLLVALDAIVIG